MEFSLNQKDTGGHSPLQLEENLKKAVTELLILHLLSQKPCYIGEISDALHEKSDGILTVVFPYAAIYRMQDAGYIAELPRRIAPDGRRRQYFTITAEGTAYLRQMRQIYTAVIGGVDKILNEGDASHE